MKKMLVVLMVGSVFSCAFNQSQNKFDLAEFDSKRAAWKALGIDAYRFTGESYDPSCPTVPVTVTVLPGTEPELTYDAEKVSKSHLFYISRGYPFTPFYGATIDELFDDIRRSTLGYFETVNPVKEDNIVKIRYNQKYHYPESYYFSLGGGGMGGQLFLDITFFEVLEGGE